VTLWFFYTNECSSCVHSRWGALNLKFGTTISRNRNSNQTKSPKLQHHADTADTFFTFQMQQGCKVTLRRIVRDAHKTSNNAFAVRLSPKSHRQTINRMNWVLQVQVPPRRQTKPLIVANLVGLLNPDRQPNLPSPSDETYLRFQFHLLQTVWRMSKKRRSTSRWPERCTTPVVRFRCLNRLTGDTRSPFCGLATKYLPLTSLVVSCWTPNTTGQKTWGKSR